MTANTIAADFARDGSVVVRGVVPPRDVASMIEAFTTIIPDGDFYPRRDDGAMMELTGIASRYEPIAAIARDPRFGALVSEALGAPVIQLLQDSLLYKPARDGASVALHRDHTYLGFLVPATIATLRIALLPEDVDNGCMWVVDGSHAWPPIGDVSALRESQVDSIDALLTDEQRAAVASARHLELAPGDITIHHCLALHGSAPNRSARARRTILLRMFDATCRVDHARIPAHAAHHFPVDADGHLAPSAFPIVHR